MKKLLVYAIAALSLVACAQEMVPEKEPENNEVIEKVKVSFKASLSQESLSKADINMTDGTGSWEKDDEIAIHTKNGKLVVLKAESDGAAVTFSGFIDSDDAILDEAVAYYPASIAVEGYGSKVNLPISYASAAVAAKSFPLRGVITGDDVVFKHIGSLMKISINNVPSSVTAIEFTAPNKAVTGDFNIGGTPECITIGSLEGSTTVSIASSASERSSSTSEFYLPMPTGTLSGFSIVLKEGSSELYTKSTANSVTLTRASLSKMKAFTPEGDGSGWYVIGGFNSWTLGTSVEMKSVLGLDNWVVARNQSIAPQDGQNNGFKFLPQNNSWDNAWGYGKITSLQTEYQCNQNPTGNDITYGDNTGTYDIYFNTNSHKFYLTSPNAPTYRTIYLMCDMELRTDRTYNLHVWKHGTFESITGDYPGIAGSIETVAGIPYYKFELGEKLRAGTYDCILNNSTSSTDNSTVRYDFRDGKLVVADDNTASYYLSFTGNMYNKAQTNQAEGYNTYGDNISNPMTQFTNPAQPQGSSNWHVVFNNASATYPPSGSMTWDGSVLVAKNVLINSSTPLTFRFTTGHDNHFLYHSGSVAIDEEITLTLNDMNRSDVPNFNVTGLLSDTYCDFYLDVINKKAKVVPSEMITLYYGLDNEYSNVYLYTWQDFNTSSFPGMEMTEYEIINGTKYYKASVPAYSVWDHTVKMIVSNGPSGEEGHWQTNDFTTADLSGSKSEYFFKINGSTITQLSGRPEAISISIDGSFSDWDNEDITENSFTYTTEGKTTLMKAYATSTNLYVYLNLKNDDESSMSYSNNESYFRLHFDTDNDSSNGYDSSNWIYGGADYLDNAKTLQTILAFYYKSDSVSNACFRGYIATDMTQKTLEDAGAVIKAADNGKNGVQVELMIPLSLIETISSSSTIKIFSVGSGNYFGKLPGVRIP